jgi:hypothetical protein
MAVALPGASGQDRRQWFSLGLLVVPLIAMGYLSLVKQWGYLNALLPVAAALALMGVECLQALLKRAQTGLRGRPAWVRAVLSAGLVLAVCWQFWQMFRPQGLLPLAQIPSNSSLQAGLRLVEHVRQTDGPVFAPAAPYLLDLAGKPTHFHASALGDLALAGQYDARLQAELKPYLQALAEQVGQARTVILPNAAWYDGLFNQETGYVCADLAARGEDLATVAGAVSVSKQICTQK